ncbi:MAG: sugar transferase [Clostridia bacterium]|jgi:putative colanic acid biosynthesis UDP-glucose lipid carrier transferase
MGYRVVKRVFDIIAALLATVVFLIPWLIISIVIKIQSPGPVIFKPERVGKDGKTFTLYKFRSMRVDSGAIHATTLRGDPRIFPFGAFLRNSKLDETPQLINILKGEMSVIGPRPEDKVNADKLYVGKYKEILSVKPGLSSPASLYDYAVGERYENEEDYEREFVPQKLNIELYYINHKSLIYDLKIIIRTVITIYSVLSKKEVKIPWEVKACMKSNP